MAKLAPSKLQAALDALAAANNRAYHAREKIMEHCLELYGAEPGQVDNDEFIDACDGGNGTCTGMTAADFDRSMREALSRSRPA